MRIVPQSATDSHTSFPVKPLLALPAPTIAGLLPSGLPPRPAPFVFD